MQATWIWFPGDYEIWLGNKMNNRRTDRGAYFPPFWKQDSHYVTVEFSTEVELTKNEQIRLEVEGDYNVKINGKMLFGMPKQFELAAGKHKINIKVHNQATPPALFLQGESFGSDASWKVTFEDKEWIDESGKASDTSATEYQAAGYWNFNSPDTKPSEFRLARRRDEALSCSPIEGGRLYDFGKETFGFAILNKVEGEGKVYLYYGESQEEALDKDFCETYDQLIVADGAITDLSTGKTKAIEADGSYTLALSKAFRHIYLCCEGNVSVESLSMDYEYLPEATPGRFRCNDELINKMWEIGEYTMQLTTREFFIDGIKRDRWVWSGDAAQSYLMNYYLFNDNECVKRTIWLLAGKAPISSHINTIMDYTFYWFNSIADYYLYSGDKAFLAQIYPSMINMMDYVLGRTDSEGMVQGLSGDWVFVDWADKPMDKNGQLAFEQVLFCQALKAMATVARTIEKTEDADKYQALADKLEAKLIPCFWNEEKQALVHNRVNGQQSQEVFRYANMFAIMYNFLDKEKKDAVVKSVIFNDEVLKITTPYMRFYELEALCMLGKQDQVMKEMKDYWGGMLAKGATSFWEKYIPEEEGRDILSMYGRPYGKSLCHAWGASPIYLLGRYYMGVQPTQAGYATWEARPVLSDMEWMEGSIPTPYGEIILKMDREHLSISNPGGVGTIYYQDKVYTLQAGETLTI